MMSNFRYDINGLRAYAVLAVTMFHFRVPGFDGGFVGVDVFFVISGFLMTQILINRMSLNYGIGWGKWVLDFYLRRAWRIIPALVILCAVLLFLGWFLLLSYDLRKLTSQIVASLTFLSNVKFFSDEDGLYFDAVSQYKFLLHSWSLSVEWQFYLIFPFILIFIWSLFRSSQYRLIALVALFAFSFGLSVFITPSKPQFAFYLLPTRAWELIAGSLIFLTPALRFQLISARSVESTGIFLILASIFLLDESFEWPGFFALVPVLGTSLVLLAARQDSFWTRPVVLQVIGNWSYSIYLWHWPIAVVLVYLELIGDLSYSFLGFVLAIILGWVSYNWVETPSRKVLTRLKPMLALISISIPIVIVISLAFVIHRMNGVPDRKMPFNLNSFEATYHSRRDECSSTGKAFKDCVYGNGKVEVILLGDSHAGSTVTAVQNALPANRSLVGFSFPGCVTLFDVLSDSNCSRFNMKVLDLLLNSLDSNISLIIVNRLDDSKIDYIKNIVSSVCKVAINRPVWLVRPLPEMPVEVPRIAAYRSLFGRGNEDISVSLAEYHARHKLVWAAQDQAAAQCGVGILDPLPFICDTNKCSGLNAGKPLYYDADHLSEYGNEFLIRMFSEVFASGFRSSR